MTSRQFDSVIRILTGGMKILHTNSHIGNRTPIQMATELRNRMPHVIDKLEEAVVRMIRSEEEARDRKELRDYLKEKK